MEHEGRLEVYQVEAVRDLLPPRNDTTLNAFGAEADAIWKYFFDHCDLCCEFAARGSFGYSTRNRNERRKTLPAEEYTPVHMPGSSMTTTVGGKASLI